MEATTATVAVITTANQGRSDAEDLLDQISNAELACRIREAEVDSLKESLKEARASYECAVSKLRQLANQSTNDAERPLFNTEDPQDDSESVNDSWKDQPISVLWADSEIKGFGKAKQEALVDDVSTLGGFEKLRLLVGRDADHLSKLLPKGVGESLADELENRHLEYIANNCSGDNQDAIQDHPADFESQLLEHAKELQQEENWLGNYSLEDIFQAGERAFKDGQPITDCPYDFGTTNLDDWLRGYYTGIAIADFESGEDPSNQYDDVDESDPIAQKVTLDEL